MPIIWRYLLGQYFKTLLLSVGAFVAILLISRLEEIANFAALSAEGNYLFLFIAYQIPYILPIALPISCLISTIILLQRLSQTQELTALRSAGLSLRSILSPLLVAACLLSALNFYIVSELATYSHLKGSLLKSELRAVNPLLLLNNKHLLRLKGLHFEAMGASKYGESAMDIVLGIPQKQEGRMHLILSKELQASPQEFTSAQTSILASLGTKKEGNPFWIENISETKAAVKDFSRLLQSKAWAVNNDHLRFSFLRIRLQEELQSFEKAKKIGLPKDQLRAFRQKIEKGYSEIARRVSLALAVFTFTLMGAAFNIKIGRKIENRGALIVIFLAAFYLASYFAAKGAENQFILAGSLYLVPHALLSFFSLWILSRRAQGREA